MLLRVRSKVGTWRVEGVGPELTVAALRSRVLAEHGVTPHPSQVFSLDPAGARVMGDEQTVGMLGLQNGDMVHLAIREEDCAHEAGKKIAADGSIVNKTHLEASRERGFRPGMMSLRSMKMHWTLTDFVELDAQFEYKIKAQKNEDPWCTKAIMEPACGDDFQVRLSLLPSLPPSLLSFLPLPFLSKSDDPWCTKAIMEPACGNDFQVRREGGREEGRERGEDFRSP